MALVRCRPPQELRPALYARAWGRNNWVTAHEDGTVAVVENGHLTMMFLHRGEVPTCMATLETNHVVVAFSSGWLRQYDIVNGFAAESVKLPFAARGMLVLETRIVAWSGLSLSIAYVRRFTLDIESIESCDDVVLRVCDSSGLAKVYDNGIQMVDQWIELDPGVIDALPATSGLWCVIWRDRWGLYDAKGQEEFGACAPGTVFCGGVRTDVGIFIQCQDGSAINVHNNNVQLLPPLKSPRFLGPFALTSDLVQYALVEEDGMHWENPVNLYPTGYSKQASVMIHGVTGNTDGSIIHGGHEKPLFTTPVLNIHNDRAYSFDSVGPINEEGLNTLLNIDSFTGCMPCPVSLSPMEAGAQPKNGEWYGIEMESVTIGFRLSASTAALFACSSDTESSVVRNLLEEGGVTGLENAIATSIDATLVKQITALLADLWDSGRITALIASGGLRALAILGAAYPTIGATKSWLQGQLPLYLDSKNIDDRIVGLRIVARHPELLESQNEIKVPLDALMGIPDAAMERFIVAFTQSPKCSVVFIRAAASHHRFDMIKSAIGLGCLSDRLIDVVTEAVAHLKTSSDARSLLSTVNDKFPSDVHFNKAHQRLIVLCCGRVYAWGLANNHRFELKAPSPVHKIEFDDDGTCVRGLLTSKSTSTGKRQRVKWQFPRGLESLFKYETIDASIVN